MNSKTVLINSMSSLFEEVFEETSVINREYLRYRDMKENAVMKIIDFIDENKHNFLKEHKRKHLYYFVWKHLTTTIVFDPLKIKLSDEVDKDLLSLFKDTYSSKIEDICMNYILNTITN